MKTRVLIGFMGSGKTSLGKMLAKKHRISFIDTDTLIERKIGGKISQIFEEKGESFFRKIETEILQELTQHSEPSIISTGGGCVERRENLPLLRKIGEIIWLQASPEEIFKRVKRNLNERPLLPKKNALLSVIKEKMRERNPLYSQIADQILDTDSLSLREMKNLLN